MMYGLTEEDINSINEIFSAHPNISRVVIFGSRAMGNYKPGSDIDLAIMGSLTYNDLLDLQHELEQLGMLYSFDLQRLTSINDPDVLAHIERAGKEFYLRQSF